MMIEKRNIRQFSAILGLSAIFYGMSSGLVLAEESVESETTWTTLGTNAGPIPSPDRFEPANVLRHGELAILVDAGDGAITQLAKAGVPIFALDAVIISHLHADHTGGLFAIVAQRLQSAVPGALKIYGPPGTEATMNGIIDGLRPSPAANSKSRGDVDDQIEIIEIADGSVFEIGAAKITAAENSHFEFVPPDGVHVSLSFRFDLPDRSIAYTGDTGPSKAVEKLARNVDVLFAEIMDPDIAIVELLAPYGDIPEARQQLIYDHFAKEHLSPREAGDMARKARAKALILTHISIEPHRVHLLWPGVAESYNGPITFARDLDTF